jgi:hypothetical protein
MDRENDNQGTKLYEVTGHVSELLQDNCRQLSQALANTPHARRHARETAELIRERLEQEKMWQH